MAVCSYVEFSTFLGVQRRVAINPGQVALAAGSYDVLSVHGGGRRAADIVKDLAAGLERGACEESNSSVWGLAELELVTMHGKSVGTSLGSGVRYGGGAMRILGKRFCVEGEGVWERRGEARLGRGVKLFGLGNRFFFSFLVLRLRSCAFLGRDGCAGGEALLWGLAGRFARCRGFLRLRGR